MGLLDRAGARLTSHPEEAEILIVNTCSFIDTAKQESVDAILEMARFKTTGSASKLIVAGCLVERYRDEIQKSIPEVDSVIGTGELESILDAAGLQSPPAASPSLFNIITATRPPKPAPARNPSPARTSQPPAPKATTANNKAVSAATTGKAQPTSCPPISTTKPPLVSSPPPAPPPTSKSPKAATTPAPSASSPTSAANSVPAASNP